MALSTRLAAALGVEPSAPGDARVDDVDRRFRDAIKAGATPISPPSDGPGGRYATLEDPETGARVRIVSDVQS